MKKVLALILALALIIAMTACGGAGTETPSGTPAGSPSAAPSAAPSASSPEAQTPSAEPESATPPAAQPAELIVFAAASMTETLTEIEKLYKEAAPHVTLIFTFDSSGTLLTQIKEGADCDVFVSAAQKQMNELDITSENNPDGLDFLIPGTRFNLVENRVALAIPAGNPAGVSSFEEAAQANSIALGNSDVPVGQYSEEIFKAMGVWEDMQGRITFGSNVKEVTSWVSEGAVDCGVVYSTDAYSAGLEVTAYAPEGTLKTPVLYPAAVLNITQNEAEAKAFLDFLKTPESAAVFEGVGFGIPS